MLKITVLMSVYNGEKYLHQAIGGILSQTFKDFELLIINDGSTDKTGEILQSYHDPRTKIINNKENIGLTKSLNKGLRLARGEYIARQDADDVSHPQRLEQQAAYFKAHSDIALLGTWGKVINQNGETIREVCLSNNPFLLKWRLLFTNQIIHSSVMFNKKKICALGGYDPHLTYSQDYDLWLRIMDRYKIALLPQILTYRREHFSDISAMYFGKQNAFADQITCKYIEKLLEKKVAIEDVHNLRGVINCRMISSAHSFKRSLEIMQDVYEVIKIKWALDVKNLDLITNDYFRMIKVIASMCANIDRQPSFDILKNAIRKDAKSLFDTSTIMCLLKILIGPKWLPRCRKFLGRPEIEYNLTEKN